MRILIIGPPGVGKGTQAKRLAEYFHLIHLSTGEILRGEMERATALGREAQKYIDQGQLVPDEILLEIMEQRLQAKDCEQGYLLDGFPRTIPQARGLDELLNRLGLRLDAAVNLYGDEEELVQRLVQRGQSSRRSDDTHEVIRQRQKVFWDQTAPLIDFYRRQGILVEINGVGPIPKITARILKALN